MSASRCVYSCLGAACLHPSSFTHRSCVQLSEEQVRGFFATCGAVLRVHLFEPQNNARNVAIVFASESGPAAADKFSGISLGDLSIRYAVLLLLQLQHQQSAVN